jgi:hypothetical protein
MSGKSPNFWVSVFTSVKGEDNCDSHVGCHKALGAMHWKSRDHSVCEAPPPFIFALVPPFCSQTGSKHRAWITGKACQSGPMGDEGGEVKTGHWGWEVAGGSNSRSA